MPLMLAIVWLIAIAVILIACNEVLSLPSIDFQGLLVPLGDDVAGISKISDNSLDISYMKQLEPSTARGSSNFTDNNCTFLELEIAYYYFI